MTMGREARGVIAANRRAMFNKGEVHPDRQEKEQQLVTACRKFYESIALLADAVDKDPPTTVEEMTDCRFENLSSSYPAYPLYLPHV